MRTHLAGNLRRLRVARRLSLSELARATSMSKATLSGIERGSANPTIDTLTALAAALGVSIGELLEQAAAEEMRVVRALDAPHASGRAGVRMLEATVSDGRAELFELSLPAGYTHESDARLPGSRSQVLVLKGQMILGPVERISELNAGDYASFPADVPHLYETVRAPSRALVIAHTPS
ncbi:MAG: XRE family transcriptional regulator [Solirubrobacteraceae bacterium]